MRRDSSVGIETGYGLDDRGTGIRVPIVSSIFVSPYRPDRLWGPPNLLYNGYRELFPGGKETGAWSWPLTSNWDRQNVALYIHSHTPSWCSAYLFKHRDNFTVIYDFPLGWEAKFEAQFNGCDIYAAIQRRRRRQIVKKYELERSEWESNVPNLQLLWRWTPCSDLQVMGLTL
jgi:hypothetical protein